MLAFGVGVPACRCDEGGTRIIQAFPERYVGVGLELAVDGEHPHVVRAIEGAAAAAAGVRAGDVIVKIDGLTTRGVSLADAVASLRGEPGTSVAIAIQRREGATETFLVKRGELSRGVVDASTLDGRSYEGKARGARSR